MRFNAELPNAHDMPDLLARGRYERSRAFHSFMRTIGRKVNEIFSSPEDASRR